MRGWISEQESGYSKEAKPMISSSVGKEIPYAALLPYSGGGVDSMMKDAERKTADKE
jgi:hypothetical protein